VRKWPLVRWSGGEGLVAAFSIYGLWIVNCDACGDRVVW
jgi:hypothetical protein